MFFGKRERVIRRVLIVEDEPLVAFDNESLLKDAGYEVVATVADFDTAIPVIEEEEGLDLVMADVALAGADDGGIRVAEAARARGIPVLFVTGSCPAHVRHLAIGCFSKPYSGRELKLALDAIDAVLRGEPVRKAPANLTIFADAA